MRESKVVNWMRIAEAVSNRSHDAQTKVGAILVNPSSGTIVATGYNGFVRGAPDDMLPNLRPEKYKYILHAEQNLICNAARYGIKTENTILICTHSPCEMCLRLLFNAGVNQVICKTLYKDYSQVVLDLTITESKLEEGFYKLSIQTN